MDLVGRSVTAALEGGDDVSGGVSMGLGGNRFEFWRIFSGVIVILPCLKTYFAIDEAKMAG